MKIGFVGLGNVGGKLARNLLKRKHDLRVFDIDSQKVEHFTKLGVIAAHSPREIARNSDVLITCLPSPRISARVMEGPDGMLGEFSGGKIWCEMSTTDDREVARLGERVASAGGFAADCPVSGGCHRAATGNISIFAGCEREVFDTIFPMLSSMGKNILHTGPLGSASVLKVITNYLASSNLLSLCEALTTAKLAGMDLNTTYEAIRISSGNSFVHETESQVILNGSRNINFTMDLVVKDLSLFQAIADRNGIELDLSPVMLEVFRDALERFGAREWSPNVIRRLEESSCMKITAPGFPEEIVDEEPVSRGREVRPENCGNS